MDQGTRDDKDKKEQEKLEKYKMNKMIVERIPARHEVQAIGKPTDEIDVEEPEEENQITRTTLFDICNGLNELIISLFFNTFFKKLTVIFCRPHFVLMND